MSHWWNKVFAYVHLVRVIAIKAVQSRCELLFRDDRTFTLVVTTRTYIDTVFVSRLAQNISLERTWTGFVERLGVSSPSHMYDHFKLWKRDHWSALSTNRTATIDTLKAIAWRAPDLPHLDAGHVDQSTHDTFSCMATSTQFPSRPGKCMHVRVESFVEVIDDPWLAAMLSVFSCLRHTLWVTRRRKTRRKKRKQ